MSVAVLPALPPAFQQTGMLAYLYGREPVAILQPDAEGAVVRELDDNSEGWHPWDRLTATPAPPLRFRIEREPMSVGPEWSPWGVFGNRPDASGDYLWGHFPTHREALGCACDILRALDAIGAR
jgi:hypothetical protein